MAEMTTIKVPKPLRETVMSAAREEGLTAAEFLQRVTDEHKRHRRFAAVRRAYAATGTDDDYAELTGEWEQTASDGLADA